MKKMKRLAAALLAVLMLTSALSACSIGEKFVPEPEFDDKPLPATYDLNDEGRVTPASCQHQTGLCWAYSTMSTVESAILTAGLAKPDELNLSEGAVAYYSYPSKDEFESGGTGDGPYFTGSRELNFGKACYYGGSPLLPFSMFANGEAIVNDADAPLATDAGELDDSLAFILEQIDSGKIDRCSDEWLLRGMNTFDEGSQEDIKRGIRKYGGLIIGMNLNTAFVTPHNSTGDPYSYYSAAAEGVPTNHVVTLIGWDDSYSKDNFGKKKPEHDGAWLVLDSTNFLSGDDGLVYISYDEYLYGAMGAMAVEMCKRGDYGDILHYDLGAMDGIKSETDSTSIANVFTAPSDKALKAVGVTTLADDQMIEIKVFVNPDGSPDGGKALIHKNAQPARKGYHVIDLDEPIALKAGNKLSIVVSYRADKDGGAQSGFAPVESAETAGEMLCPTVKDTATLQFKADAGESFAMYEGKWYDLSDEATAKVFGKNYSIGSAGIKALLEA